MEEQEIWKPIEGTDNQYYISSHGRIYSTKTKIIMKTPKEGRGYANCNLTIEGKYINVKIHKLVAKHFIPNIDNKPFINHIDFCRTNNCVENLEWCTQKENIHHSLINGKYIKTQEERDRISKNRKEYYKTHTHPMVGRKKKYLNNGKFTYVLSQELEIQSGDKYDV